MTLYNAHEHHRSRTAGLIDPNSLGLYWYLSGEISLANCKGAYQAKGASSLSASYINLANPGTNDLTVVNSAPGWASDTGWVFDRTSKYFNTGLVPILNNWSIIVQYANSGSNSSVGYCLIGARNSSSCIVALASSWWGDQILCCNGAETGDTPQLLTGNLAMAGVSLYRDGVYDSDKSSGSGTITLPLWIGNLNYGGNDNADFRFSGNIYAVAIYDTVLTSSQVSAIHIAMSNL